MATVRNGCECLMLRNSCFSRIHASTLTRGARKDCRLMVMLRGTHRLGTLLGWNNFEVDLKAALPCSPCHVILVARGAAACGQVVSLSRFFIFFYHPFGFETVQQRRRRRRGGVLVGRGDSARACPALARLISRGRSQKWTAPAHPHPLTKSAPLLVTRCH